MFSWWGMAVCAAVLAAWFHWEAGTWRLKRFSDGAFVASDLGATVFIGLAVYVTAA